MDWDELDSHGDFRNRRYEPSRFRDLALKLLPVSTYSQPLPITVRSDSTAMSTALQQRLYDELSQLVLIDPHTHINPHSPASKTLADILGYHYYTELAHSAGMPREHIEEPGISPKEKVGRIAQGLGHIDNTAQLSWLLELSRELFGFEADRIDGSNWEVLYDASLAKMNQPDWEQRVLTASKLEAVFLTNDFDDDLAGFDTTRYVPCLRTDELVFHFAKPTVRQRLAKCSNVNVQSLSDLKKAIAQRFQHFKSNGVRAARSACHRSSLRLTSAMPPPKQPWLASFIQTSKRLRTIAPRSVTGSSGNLPKTVSSSPCHSTS